VARRRPPQDLHEHVAFDDPDEARTWVFDVTFLTSSWHCIFGQGCPGVLDAPAPELVQGCCSYGAHFVDEDDRAHVEAMAERMTADQWQFKAVAQRRGGPVKVNRDGEIVSRLVDDACIFLNRPGFPAGPGCSLHQAAVAAGERFMDWKPEVCWQVPLRRVDDVDPYGHVTSTLREWKRRDWGEGGEAFHWWCTEEPDAFGSSDMVVDSLRDEIVGLVGEAVYQQLLEHLVLTPTVTPVPHPAVRRR
jgi:hypothetical protein